MIEKMKKVTLFCQAKKRREMLDALQSAGVLHVSNLVKKSEKIDERERNISSFKATLYKLEEYRAKSKAAEEKSVVLSPSEITACNDHLVSLFEEKKNSEEKLLRLKSEFSELQPWGDISTEDLKAVKEGGVELHFYTIGKKEYQSLLSNESVTFVKLKEVNKQLAIAVVGAPLAKDFPANEFVLPPYSLNELNLLITQTEASIKGIEEEIADSVKYAASFKAYLKLLGQDLIYERVDETTAVVEEEISYLSGYLPEVKVDDFKKVASAQGWAYIIDDPGEGDNPPTLVKYKGIVRIIRPVFDILGVVPGYREYDISMYFLLFFSLFFAMIIGDAGYGLIFLLGAIALHVKSRKCSDINILLYVLSVVTIVWGSLTGTWFGSEKILLKLPFLQHLVIPSIANYPALFGVDADFAQNMVMKFCFILGTVQLSLACVINMMHKIPEKNLSWIGDLGWCIDIVVIYGLVLQLVIGETCNFQVVVGGVATGFVLVCLFGAQQPGKSFISGVKAGLGGFFTTFLNTISCFSNIMSYIRLFAVGMASLAIAQSFNNMASGLLSGFALPAGLLVILLGHALNLVMGLLSVVVHGVRLNLLEFSGQLGMEWSGYKYEPFEKTVEENVVGNN
jgi:Archaeal/vacuolar-type H+-ATPase subunit I